VLDILSHIHCIDAISATNTISAGQAYCKSRSALANLSAHDLPALALQDLVNSTVEQLSIGG
jgi:hypothetical protein